ncbi:hypothetical protein JL722_9860 [Aureococcus anophagefferens]|nr:hypothetical protein JL722_9860 [Aureococcus anophagefferens]
MERSLESPSDVDGLGHDMEALDLENEPVLTLLPADDGARVMCGDVAATAALRDAVVLEDGAFEQKLNAALPQWHRPATDDELVQLGYAKLAGREFFVNPNEAQLERPTVPVPASARWRRTTSCRGQPLYVNRAANEAQLERPTVPVPASARPATDDELRGFGYETLAASGREFCVRLHEAHFQRPTVPVPPTRRPATDEELAELGYQKETLADGREFYRDAKETHRPRPLLAPVPAAALRVDRGAFLDCYARLATRLSALTPHQREKLDAVRARVAVLTAPAGGGKTFVAIQLARESSRRRRARGFSSCDDDGVDRGPRAVGREPPVETVVETVALTEVVRSTKRIVAGAKAFQLEAGRKADTRSHHSESAGPPLEARLFDVVGDEAACYAREVVAAIESIRRQLHGVDLDDRLAVAVVNRRVPGGWLEFLGRLELTEGAGFDEERAKFDRLETAADEVVASCAGEPAAAVAPKVHGVAVFPDGRRVVSGSNNNKVKVWDAATGECVATLAGHLGLVWRGVLVLSGVISLGF